MNARVNRVKMEEPAQTSLVDTAVAVRQGGLGANLTATKVSYKAVANFGAI